MKRIKQFLLASCLLPGLMAAQGGNNAYFLGLTPDAQSAGMAGTGLAVTDNAAAALFHNASTLIFSQEMMGAHYSYSHINSDYAMHAASVFYKMGREGNQGFTAGFRHFKTPELGGTDSFRPRIWDIEAGYFSKLGNHFSGSLTLRYIQSKIGQDAIRRSACIDLGATYHHELNWLDGMAAGSIGVQAANLGRKLDGAELPATVGLGGALDLPFNMDNRLQVALDFNCLLPSGMRHLQAGLGAEYNFLKYGVVRAGYRIGDKDKGIGSYGTLGCGINFWPIRADFSYVLADSNCLMHHTWMIGFGIAL